MYLCKKCSTMETIKIEWILFFIVVLGLSIKLLYYFFIPKRRLKLYFRSLVKWYNPAHIMEDLDDNVEAFLKISNYCNLAIWIGSGILVYLLAYSIIFPD